MALHVLTFVITTMTAFLRHLSVRVRNFAAWVRNNPGDSSNELNPVHNACNCNRRLYNLFMCLKEQKNCYLIQVK